jgi:iron complex transport system ATP-binding protein
MRHAVVIDNVHVAYGATTVLQGICCDIAQGEIVVCIGPNGAGKSSLLRAIAGVIPLAQGRILVHGESIHAMPPAQRATHVAVVPQQVHMPVGFSVFEIVAMARYVHHPWYTTLRSLDNDIIWDALQRAGVAEFAHKQATQLSGGEQQRVAFARAIAQQPQVLILDESTAHLDLRHQYVIIQTVQQMAKDGVTVIAAMHDINLAAVTAQRICLLDAGRIVHCGTPHDVLQPQHLSAVYETPLHVVPHAAGRVPYFHITIE